MSKAQILPRNVSTASEAFANPVACHIVQDGDGSSGSSTRRKMTGHDRLEHWQVVAFQRNNEDGRRRAMMSFQARSQKSVSDGRPRHEAWWRTRRATRCETSSIPNYYKRSIWVWPEQWGEMDRNGLMGRWIR